MRGGPDFSAAANAAAAVVLAIESMHEEKVTRHMIAAEFAVTAAWNLRECACAHGEYPWLDVCRGVVRYR